MKLAKHDGKKVRQMAKTPSNSGKPWKPAEVKQLRELARENTPTRVIRLKLERTPEAVQSKASEENIFAQADEPVAVQPLEVNVQVWRCAHTSTRPIPTPARTMNAPAPRPLTIVVIDGRTYFRDLRLREFRASTTRTIASRWMMTANP